MFENMIITAIQLDVNDLPILYGAVMAYGGQYRDSFTDDITHFVCLKPEGTDYEKALKLNLKIVLPHFFNDCLKIKRNLPIEPYLFPNPMLFNCNPEDFLTRNNMNVKSRKSGKLELDTEKTLFLSDYCFFLSQSFVSALPLSEYNDIIEKLSTFGASFVETYKENLVQIVLLETRDSYDYVNAINDGKIVANLYWVQEVIKKKFFIDPGEFIFYQPIPSKKIPGLNKIVASVSNYVNDARDHVIKMCELVGIQYTPELSKICTHLICGYPNGKKYVKADEWNLQIVNHLWLEECLFYWEHRKEGRIHYSAYPPSLGSIVGKITFKEKVKDWVQEVELVLEKRKQQELVSDVESSLYISHENDNRESVDEGDLPNSYVCKSPPLSKAYLASPKKINLMQPDEKTVVDLTEDYSGSSIKNQEREVEREQKSVHCVSPKKVTVETYDYNHNKTKYNSKVYTSEDTSINVENEEKSEQLLKSDIVHKIVEEKIEKFLEPQSEKRIDDKLKFTNKNDLENSVNGFQNRESNGKKMNLEEGDKTISLESDIKIREEIHFPRIKNSQPAIAQNTSHQLSTSVENHKNNILSKNMVVESEPQRKFYCGMKEANIVDNRLTKLEASGATKEKEISALSARAKLDIIGNEEVSESNKEEDFSNEKNNTQDNDSKKKIPLSSSSAKRKNSSVTGENVTVEESKSVTGVPQRKKRKTISSVSPAIHSKESNKDKDNIRIMFTGCDTTSEFHKILKSMGASVITDVQDNPTHLIATKIIRTEKFLLSISKVSFVLNLKWIGASIAADEEEYFLVDKESEKKFNFNLKEAITRSKANPEKKPLKGYLIIVSPRAVPAHGVLEKIVHHCGGEFMSLSIKKNLQKLEEYLKYKNKLDKTAEDTLKMEDVNYFLKFKNLVFLSCEENKQLKIFEIKEFFIPKLFNKYKNVDFEIYLMEPLLSGALNWKISFTENDLLYRKSKDDDEKAMSNDDNLSTKKKNNTPQQKGKKSSIRKSANYEEKKKEVESNNGNGKKYFGDGEMGK
ncbi:hypothetical protein HK099_000825 [Clydaea vesicula]|uniref:BRCT domain-containing protein n=1 Tax=Clydaea vesicula TaxID=447962 RepID=A0AAD5TXD7_9FUNG|nr:hypothetical protein HK099_000825 [Clydaea vesicula]